jgi:hypothetical protein
VVAVKLKDLGSLERSILVAACVHYRSTMSVMLTQLEKDVLEALIEQLEKR